MDNSERRLIDLAALHQVSFEVSTVVYRRATATASWAERMAAEHARTGKSERRMRELDAVIETIMLVQAAFESWIYFAYRHTGAEPGTKRGWVNRWIEAPALICDRERAGDRPPTRALDQVTVATLRRIGAWRNFLMHNDDQSRDKLRQELGQEPAIEMLTAEMARHTLSSADQAFGDLGSLLGVHGVHGLSSDHLWISYDELWPPLTRLARTVRLGWRRSAAAWATVAGYGDLVKARLQHRNDGLMWLRFDDREFAVGDLITPGRYLPPEWKQLHELGQLRLDRLYIVRATSPDHVSPATWNERRRWCYEVIPQRPIEPDPDPTHSFMISRMCRSARVVRVLRHSE